MFLHNLTLFLPAAVAIFWAVALLVLSFRVDSVKYTVALFGLLSVFLFATAFRWNSTYETKILLRALVLLQFAGPCVIPLFWLYLRQIARDNRHPHLSLIWIVLPAVLGTASFILYQTVGEDVLVRAVESIEANPDAAAQYKGTTVSLFMKWTMIVYPFVVFAEDIFIIVYLFFLAVRRRMRFGKLRNFFFKGERISMLQLNVSVIIVIFTLYYVTLWLPNDLKEANTWIVEVSAILTSGAIFFFGYVALFNAKDTITRKEMRSGFRYNYGSETKGEVVEDMLGNLLDDAEDEAIRMVRARLGVHEEPGPDHPAMAAEAIFTTVASSWDEDGLLSRFQKLMQEEQLFLQPSLSLGDVAEKLNTNKTYVSKMVNNTYNLGFPELLNTLRIDYAQQYILNHRGAKQEEIAHACGFLSASSFNNIFKKLTGVTPKMWLAGYLQKEG